MMIHWFLLILQGTANYSAIIDKRWVEIVNDNLIKITLWYDNEYAYSRRVVDLSRHLFDFEPKMNLDESNSLSPDFDNDYCHFDSQKECLLVSYLAYKKIHKQGCW